MTATIHTERHAYTTAEAAMVGVKYYVLSRAECACGWTGDLLDGNEDARQQAEGHDREHHI